MARASGVGPGRLWRGLVEEIGATLATARRTSAMFWLFCGIFYIPLSTAGLLPLGRFSLILQCITLSIFGLFMLMPEVLAREARKDDQLGLREREGAEVVTHLPVLMVLSAFPFYLVGQAVLFRLVMRHAPGVVPGDGWGEAWLLSLNNLLYSEIFLDVIDVFRLGLVPDPQHRLGQAMVFITRAILSVAFIRIVIVIFRAAWYRAHGLGRGVDLLAALRAALGEKDWVEARLTTQAIAAGIRRTVDTLVDRLGGPDRDAAWGGLGALRDWAIPHLLRRQAAEPAAAPALGAVAQRLLQPVLPVAPAPARVRPGRLVTALAVVTGAVAAAALLPGWLGLGVGVAVLGGLGWLLVTPRTSIERGMRFGILPAIGAARLAPATLIWATAVTAVLMLTAFFVFGRATTVAGTAFVSSAPVVGGREIVGFLAANLLRLQVFFSAPDIFAFGVPSLEQRPLLGSLLTLLLRTALNVGLLAVVLTALSVAWSRAVVGSNLIGNDDLMMRVEALTGGRFAPELARHHAGAVQEELLNLLAGAAEPEAEAALVDGGAYEWLVARPATMRLGDLVPASKAAAWIAESGWTEPAVALVTAVERDQHALFAPGRVRVRALCAIALDRAGQGDRARSALHAAADELAREAGAMHPSDRIAAESAVVRAAAALTPPAPGMAPS